MATHSFPVLPAVSNILVDFSPEKLNQDKKSTLKTLIYLLDLAIKGSLKTSKWNSKRSQKSFNIGRTGIQYVAMVT